METLTQHEMVCSEPENRSWRVGDHGTFLISSVTEVMFVMVWRESALPSLYLDLRPLGCWLHVDSSSLPVKEEEVSELIYLSGDGCFCSQQGEH